MRFVSAAAAATALILSASAGHTQIGLGVRYGQGVGSAHYHEGEVHARVRVLGPTYVTAAYEMIGGIWGCVDSPVEAIRCGTDGNAVTMGASFALTDQNGLYLAASASVGAFTRTGTCGGAQYRGDRHLTRGWGWTLNLPSKIRSGFKAVWVTAEY